MDYITAHSVSLTAMAFTGFGAFWLLLFGLKSFHKDNMVLANKWRQHSQNWTWAELRAASQ